MRPRISIKGPVHPLVRPLVRPSDGPFVGPSVRWSVCCSVTLSSSTVNCFRILNDSKSLEKNEKGKVARGRIIYPRGLVCIVG